MACFVETKLEEEGTIYLNYKSSIFFKKKEIKQFNIN